jgi:hypothetical protein
MFCSYLNWVITAFYLSVCYICAERDISMSLEYIGTSGRGEVSFSIHVSKLYKRTKWPVWLKIIPSLRSTRWSHFYKQKEWDRSRLIVGYWVLMAGKFRAEVMCLCGATNLKMAQRHWMIIQRNLAQWLNCVTVEGLIRENWKVKVRETHCKK